MGTTATMRRASRPAAARQGATSTAPCTRSAPTCSCPVLCAVHRSNRSKHISSQEYSKGMLQRGLGQE